MIHNLERDLIAMAVVDSSEIRYLEPEDFQRYAPHWKAIKEAKGDHVKLFSKHPELMGFEMRTYLIPKLAPRVALKLIESTFSRTLDKVLIQYTKNSTKSCDALILSEIKKEIENEDILDMVVNLPEYMRTIGLDDTRIKSWSNYCKKRIDVIKQLQ